MQKLLYVDLWKGLSETLIQWSVKSLPVIVLVIILAIVALRVSGFVLKRARPVMLKRLKKSRKLADEIELEKRVDTLLGILRSTFKIVIWSIVLILVLSRVGVNIAPLIAGAGIAGLAIGFGAQELVRDVIAGFFMLLENQIRSGDVAVINGTGGLVESVGLRTTVLRDLSGVVHVFQNGKISSLSNMTKDWSGMVFDIGVAYKEDTDKVSEIMKQVAEELRADPQFSAKIKEPIEIFGVDEFSDSAVIIKARFKTKPIQQWEVGREYRRRLKKAFDKNGIEIPFPHTTLYAGSETDPLPIRLLKGKGN